jgi:hypothetical protein
MSDHGKEREGWGRKGKWHRRAVYPLIPLLCTIEAVRVAAVTYVELWGELLVTLREHKEEER